MKGRLLKDLRAAAACSDALELANAGILLHEAHAAHAWSGAAEEHARAMIGAFGGGRGAQWGVSNRAAHAMLPWCCIWAECGRALVMLPSCLPCAY